MLPCTHFAKGRLFILLCGGSTFFYPDICFGGILTKVTKKLSKNRRIADLQMRLMRV